MAGRRAVAGERPSLWRRPLVLGPLVPHFSRRQIPPEATQGPLRTYAQTPPAYFSRGASLLWKPRRRSALLTTQMELRLMAAAPNIGDSCQPSSG